MTDEPQYRRRLEDKLADEEHGNEPPIPGLEDADSPELPLYTKPVRVARFNRKVVGAILALVAIVTAASLIYSLSPSPKREKVAEEEGRRNQPQTLPVPPETLTGAPANYGEASKKLPPGVPRLPESPGGSPATPPGAAVQGVQGGETVAKLPGEAAPPIPSFVPAPVGATTLPASAAQSRLEERRKELQEAKKSPVEFSTGEGAKAPALPQIPQAQLAPQVQPQQPQQPPSDDQNLQYEKRDFSERKKEEESVYVKADLLKPVSPFEIKAGTIFPASLITGINSDLPGQITAQISENVYDTVAGKHLLIPQGTRAVGEYDSKVAYGQERVLVVWHRLIFPNGNSISLEGMPGVDLSGYSGLKDRVNNHYWKLISGVVLGSIIGAGAQVAVGGQGSPNTAASFGQLATSGAAQNLNQAGQQITQKNLQMQPTIEIRPGVNVNIFATKDLILEPYSP